MSSLTKKWVSISFYRARARSEMKAQSVGIELAWLDGRTEEVPLRGSWLTKKGMRISFYRARALSEMKARSAGIELAWLDGRKLPFV